MLFVFPCGFSLSRLEHEAERLTSREGFADLRAARGGRVYLADGQALFNRPGPRLLETMECVAEMLHPDLFPSRPGGASGGLSDLDRIAAVRRGIGLALFLVLAAPAAGWLAAGGAGAACRMSCHAESGGEEASCCALSGGAESSSVLGCPGSDPGALSPSLRLARIALPLRLSEPVLAGLVRVPRVARTLPGSPRSLDHVPLSSF